MGGFLDAAQRKEQGCLLNAAKTKLFNIYLVNTVDTVSYRVVEGWGLSYEGHQGPKNNISFVFFLFFFRGNIFPQWWSHWNVSHLWTGSGSFVIVCECVLFLLCLSSASCWAVSSFSLSVFSYFPFVHSSSCHAFVSVAPLLLLMLSHIYFE